MQPVELVSGLWRWSAPHPDWKLNAVYLPSRILAADLRELLRPLLDLPIERVLVSHGTPVLAGGHRALVRALR